jgi:hypothetical protein
MRKEETIEEVAEKANGYNVYAKETKAPIFKEGFIEGAKWQQQQNNNLYSEEDMRDYASYILLYDAISPKKWFEQFKKKQ